MNGIFKAKMYGAVTVGQRGQLVIPAVLRKALRIKAGDKLMVFAKPDKKTISLMPEEDFTDFLRRASTIISRLEDEIPKKKR